MMMMMIRAILRSILELTGQTDQVRQTESYLVLDI